MYADKSKSCWILLIRLTKPRWCLIIDIGFVFLRPAVPTILLVTMHVESGNVNQHMESEGGRERNVRQIENVVAYA